MLIDWYMVNLYLFKCKLSDNFLCFTFESQRNHTFSEPLFRQPEFTLLIYFHVRISVFLQFSLCSSLYPFQSESLFFSKCDQNGSLCPYKISLVPCPGLVILFLFKKA